MHKYSVGGHEGYIIVGMYEEGTPGEIFIKMAKEGSTLSGFMDGVALSISIGLQHGVPLKVFVDKLANTRFEPSGYTENPKICFVSSVLDYIARWLGGKFLSPEYLKPKAALGDQEAVRRLSSAPAVNMARPASIKPSKNTEHRHNRRCTLLPALRHAHRAERQLLQVCQLREYQRMF